MLPWIRSNKRNYKKVAMTLSCLFLVTFFVFSFASVVAAQGGDTFGINKVGSFLPLGGEDIRIIAAKIIRIFLSLLGIVAVGLMIYAGFTWMTSGGNEEKIATAKKTMINAVIGLAIIMASFAIVQFVLKSLQGAVGINNEQDGRGVGLNFESYVGSGSLGRIIKDHYPLRGQTEVKRNTRIAVTFRESVDPASVIVNTNGNQIVGDCINMDNPGFNWGPQFCDQLNTSSVKIGITGTSTEPLPSAALTLLEGENRDAFTFTFRPLALLGSGEVSIDYTVELTRNILKKDGRTSIFAADRHGFYKWRFSTDTTIDVDPPHVVSVYPESGDTEPRNSLIQINFNEPMDPLVVQGASGADSPFSHIIFQSVDVDGEWRISNGYKTVEFISSLPCGQNSCGDTMYCLPVKCAEGNGQCADPYTVLIRTALTLNNNSFESVAMSGVTDMSGNALDNGPGNIADGRMANPHKPGFVQNEPKVIHDAEKNPDNYFWNFSIDSSVDRAAPYLEQVTPNLDAENVSEDAPLQMFFNKRLYSFSLEGIALEEYPRPADLIGNNPAFENLGDIWYRPEASTSIRTVVTLNHREFGPQGTNFYYFPLLPSTIKSITQNCFHPGRGPFVEGAAKPNGEISPACEHVVDQNGAVILSNGCVPIPNNFNSEQDTGCVQYSDPGIEPVFSSTSTCMDMMKKNNISPFQPIVPAQGAPAQPQ